LKTKQCIYQVQNSRLQVLQVNLYVMFHTVTFTT